MDIFIDPKSDVGLANQIYEAIRSAILDGRFAPGDRLPASRELAGTLGVSRHTVTTAYGNLTAEGFLDGRRGGGTVVSGLFALGAPEVRNRASFDLPSSANEEDFAFDLRPGTPDPRLFPTAEWRRHARLAVDLHEAVYGEPAGSPDLRLVLARWIGKSRGVDTTFRNLIVTSGAQQAFFLILGVCVSPGTKIAMEDPGYGRFRAVASARGAEIVPVPVDDEGIVVEAIPHDVAAVYVTPSHQYPTGVTMSMSRRLELLRLASDNEFVVIEDDYDSEFRYVERPLEPLHRLDRSSRVVYVGSFSKTLSPALRLGFLITPPNLTRDVLELRAHVDWAPSLVDQLTLRSYIAEGEFDRHLRRTRLTYRARYELLTRWLETEPAKSLLEAYRSHAGLHICARLAPVLNEAATVQQLAQRGIAVEGLSTYGAGRHPGARDTSYSAAPNTASRRGGLVIGLGQVDESELTEALRLVGEVLVTS